MADAPRPPHSAEQREIAELTALRKAHPELSEAIDLQVDLLGLYRRVQGRISVPWIDISTERVRQHAEQGRPLVAFDAIPIDLTDLRLLVRQTTEALQRHGLLDRTEYDRIQALGRDLGLLMAVGRWYRDTSERHLAGPSRPPSEDDDPTLAQVLTLAVRPFLARCADVLQPRTELSHWTCGHCAVCGGEPELGAITSTEERLLVCGRCGLQWSYTPHRCVWCENDDRSRMSEFATADGRYRVDACAVCRRYLKVVDVRRTKRPVMPAVDAIATLPLDAAAQGKGFSA